jgi:hypothetical protein
MFAWIAALPLGLDLLVFFVIVGLVVGAAFFIRWLVKRGASVKIGRNGVTIKAKEIKDLFEVKIPKLLTLQSEIDFIRYTETMRNRLAFAEMKCLEIVNLVTSTHEDLLTKTVAPEVPSETLEYLAFHRLVLLMLHEEMLPKFRVAMRENHLEDLSEPEFRLYLSSKILYFVNCCKEYLRDRYRKVSDRCPPLEVLKDHINDKQSNVERKIEEVFVQARILAFKDSERVAKIRVAQEEVIRAKT